MNQVDQGAGNPGLTDAPSEATDATSKSASKYLNELARKEKEFQARAQAWKSKEDEWHKKESEYQQKFISKDALKSNPLAAFQEAGMTPEDIMNLALNPPDARDLKIQQLESRLEQFLGKFEQMNTDSQKQTQDSYQKALDTIRKQTAKLVEDSGEAEDYEMIKAMGDDGISAVVAKIEENFKETGLQMSVEEAAKAIEQDFLERTLAIAQKNKIKSKLLESQTQQDPKQTPQGKAPQGLQTLTHTNTQPSSKPMSARDRAIAAFKGELKT